MGKKKNQHSPRSDRIKIRLAKHSIKQASDVLRSNAALMREIQEVSESNLSDADKIERLRDIQERQELLKDRARRGGKI